MKNLSVALAVLVSAATIASADPCEPHQTAHSNLDYLRPGSIPAAELGEALHSGPASNGILFDVEIDGAELLVDVVEFPAETPFAVGLLGLL